MAGADGDGQRITAGALDKLLHVFRTGVGGVLRLDLDFVLHAGEGAQLSLDHDAVVVSIFDNLAGDADVFLKRFAALVDHDGGKAAVDAAFA